MKDHFISEIKDIRESFSRQLNSIYKNTAKPKQLIAWFKLMNIKIDGLHKTLPKKYKISKDILNPYGIELRELITNSDEFIKGYKNDEMKLTAKMQSDILMFQQRYNHLFNEIIVKINNAK